MKKKIAVLIGIALSTILLISPALASGVDTLEIYGNANEDDTIDMRDLTYVKLIFFGKKTETELADAKYDGKLNPLDFIQIKLIIVGKEKEITVVDTADRIVTVKMPVERVVLFTSYQAEAVRTFKGQDKVVGIASYIKLEYPVYFPELSKLPAVGEGSNPDYEAILSINPDLVVGGIKYPEKLPGIPVVSLGFSRPGTMNEEMMKLGYIFGKKDEAKHYTDDFHDKYIDLIKARTGGLSEEGRPKVYVENQRGDYRAFCAKSGAQQMIDLCGGRNIFADHDGGTLQIDPEEVVVRNPDIIVKHRRAADVGYKSDDTSKTRALWECIMNRPELANVNAVKNRRVYIIDLGLNYGLDYPIALTYWAKWFHPDLFEDLDPQAIHQEFLTEYQGLDYDLDKHGVFVYHPEEHPDGK